jgi:hypothetical protein
MQLNAIKCNSTPRNAIRWSLSSISLCCGLPSRRGNLWIAAYEIPLSLQTSQDIPSPSDPKSCQWRSTNLGARHVARGTARGRSSLGSLGSGQRPNTSELQRLTMWVLQTCSVSKKEFVGTKNQLINFLSPCTKHMYMYMYIYIIYTWLLAFVKTLDPLWASKSLGFMDVHHPK